MRILGFALLMSGILLGASTVTGQDRDSLDAFPQADEGMQRFVLQLDPKDDESRFQVQLIVGKTLALDSANRYFFTGTLETINVEGWGYDSYVVKEFGPMAGTRMAANPDAPKVKRFISIGGAPTMIRYNSKLPVVVYVPSGAEVRYRIWRADDEKVIPKG